MGSDSSETEGGEDVAERGTAISLGLPVRESDLFKHRASEHVLNFLSDNPDVNVSLRQLARVTPVSERSTRKAVDVLEANELVETVHEGNARRVHINRSKLRKPDDPIRSIPQTEFQTPVRVAQCYIEDELDEVQGIVLFGSVARGEADRQSDVDLWVLVGGDYMQQRHEANKLAQRLGELRIPSTVAVTDALNVDFENRWETIRETLEGKDQNGSSTQRHSFEILVETPQSIISQASSVDAEALFGEGITLLSTELLERTKLEVIGDE